MKTFKQFLLMLKESARTPRIRSISHSQAHEFTKNSPSGQTRFIVDKDDKLHVGDAGHFIHAEIATHKSGEGSGSVHWRKNTKYVGYISHKHGYFSVAKPGEPNSNDDGYPAAGELEGRAKDLEDHLTKNGYKRGKDGEWDL